LWRAQGRIVWYTQSLGPRTRYNNSTTSVGHYYLVPKGVNACGDIAATDNDGAPVRGWPLKKAVCD
jgi:hypothetical protein